MLTFHPSSETAAHRSLTTAASRSGFDNDRVIMNSMLRLGLGKTPRQPFAARHMKND